jgi:hypothetical protein
MKLGEQIAVRERGQEEGAEEVIKWRMSDSRAVLFFHRGRGQSMSSSRPEVGLLHGDIHLSLEATFGGNVLSGGKATITNQESSILEMARLIGCLPGWDDGAIENASDEAKGEEQDQYLGPAP